MLERRRFLRIPLSAPIQFKKIGYIKDERNISKDLSVRGVRFLSQRFVPVSSYIKIEVHIKKNYSPIKFISKVIWIKSVYDDELFEVGVQIWDISKEDNDFLRNALNY
jgi:hypothetical protein